jgi:beta-catenin-like protein 1
VNKNQHQQEEKEEESNEQRTAEGIDVPGPERSLASASPLNKRARRGVQIAEERNTTLEYDLAPALLLDDHEKNNAGRLRLLEEAERKSRGTKIVDPTPRGVRVARMQLSKAVERNALERDMHPDDPVQFMDSEIALYEHVSSLKSLAADPGRLYPPVMESDTDENGDSHDDGSLWSSLCELLTHPNPDVAAAVVSLLVEWLDSGLVAVQGEDQPGGGSSLQKDSMERQSRAVVSLATLAVRDALDSVVAQHLLLASHRHGGANDEEDGRNEEVGDNSDEDDDVGNGVFDVLSLLENLLEIDQFVQTQSSSSPSSSLSLTTSLSPDGSSSLASHLCRLGVLRWLVWQLQRSSNRYHDRALEILVLIASRDDTYRVFPDWSRIGPSPPASPPDAINGGKRRGLPHEIPDKSGAESPSVDAVEALLQIVARFRKVQPADESELSLLENACLVMNAALLYSGSNLEAFVRGQGIELALRCVKERIHAGGLALQWLDVGTMPLSFSSSANAREGEEEGGDSIRRRFCEHVVKVGALKFLFPLFMGRHTPKAAPVALSSSSSLGSNRAKKEWAAKVESTVISVLYCLTVRLCEDSPLDAKRRLVAKFVEPDKCDRLVELCLAYDRKARQAEFDFYRDVEESMSSEGDPSLAGVAALAARLEGGGDVLHHACAIAAFCCVESRRCHERILSQLRLQGSGITLIRDALLEFVANLDDGRPQKAQIASYLERI